MHIQLDFFIPIWVLVLVSVLLGIVQSVRLYLNVWRDYLAIFHLKKVDEAEGLPPFAAWLGNWVLLPIGLFRDWALNQVLTIVFLDLPHSPFEVVTGRLQRYIWAPDPQLPADAPSWQRALWPVRLTWWRLHAWWWRLMPWRRDLALWIDYQQLDFADKDHTKKGPQP